MQRAFYDDPRRTLRAGRAGRCSSSHVLSEVERVCDRVAVVRAGRLVADEDVAIAPGAAEAPRGDPVRGRPAGPRRRARRLRGRDRGRALDLRPRRRPEAVARGARRARRRRPADRARPAGGRVPRAVRRARRPSRRRRGGRRDQRAAPAPDVARAARCGSPCIAARARDLGFAACRSSTRRSAPDGGAHPVRDHPRGVPRLLGRGPVRPRRRRSRWGSATRSRSGCSSCTRWASRRSAIAGERQRGTLEVLLGPAGLAADRVRDAARSRSRASRSSRRRARSLGTVVGVGGVRRRRASSTPAASRAPVPEHGRCCSSRSPAICLAASASFDRRRAADRDRRWRSCIGGYVLEVLGTLWPDAAFLQPYSPFHYLRPFADPGRPGGADGPAGPRGARGRGRLRAVAVPSPRPGGADLTPSLTGGCETNGTRCGGDASGSAPYLGLARVRRPSVIRRCLQRLERAEDRRFLGRFRAGVGLRWGDDRPDAGSAIGLNLPTWPLRDGGYATWPTCAPSPAMRGARRRHAVGARPPPARVAEARHVRVLGVLDDPHRGRRGDDADRDRAVHRLHRVPQPGAAREDGETLDEVSGGRVVLGLGQRRAGARPVVERVRLRRHAARRRGTPRRSRSSRRLVRERALTFEGEHYRVDEAEIIPRGPRPGAIRRCSRRGLGERTRAGRRPLARGRDQRQQADRERRRREPRSDGDRAARVRGGGAGSGDARRDRLGPLAIDDDGVAVARDGSASRGSRPRWRRRGRVRGRRGSST